MTSSTFLSLFEKLEGLVQRLPESLQQPILREITPIKTLFLLQRAPRLVLVGERAVSKSELVNAIFGQVLMGPETELLHDGVWQPLSFAGRGTLQVLDGRRPVSLSAAELALRSQPGDIFLFLSQSSALDGEFQADLVQAVRLLEVSGPQNRPRVLGLQCAGGETAREQLHAVLHTQPEVESTMIGTLSFSGGPGEIERLVELLGVELPPESQLEMARLSGNRVLQRQIAHVLIKSVTAICGAIGVQPIPLADFPILSSLQAGLVAGIMHISGRAMSARLAGEFMAALGANFGAGIALREGTRAVLKFLPLWGNAISGAVAAAGTYAVGRGAVAYFIDEVSIEDARTFFRRDKKPPTLKG